MSPLCSISQVELLEKNTLCVHCVHNIIQYKQASAKLEAPEGCDHSHSHGISMHEQSPLYGYSRIRYSEADGEAAAGSTMGNRQSQCHRPEVGICLKKYSNVGVLLFSELACKKFEFLDENIVFFIITNHYYVYAMVAQLLKLWKNNFIDGKEKLADDRSFILLVLHK